MKLQPILIPTEDASHLMMLSNGELKHFEIPLSKKKEGVEWLKPKHAYLVSDAPIKEGEWVLLPSGVIQKMSNKDMLDYLESESFATKKIEFTTDPKLIADEVLAIDGNTKAYFIKEGSFNITGFGYKPIRIAVNLLTELCKRWNDKADMVIDYNNNILTFMENKPTSQSARIQEQAIQAVKDRVAKKKGYSGFQSWKADLSENFSDPKSALIKFMEDVVIEYSSIQLEAKDVEIEELKFHVKKIEDLVFAKDGVILELRSPKQANFQSSLLDQSVQEVDQERYGKPNDHLIQVPLNDYIHDKHNQDECSGFIDGFKACQALQSKAGGYNEEQLRKAWSNGYSCGLKGDIGALPEDYLQSLTPTQSKAGVYSFEEVLEWLDEQAGRVIEVREVRAKIQSLTSTQSEAGEYGLIKELIAELKETYEKCLPEFRVGIQHSILRASAYLENAPSTPMQTKYEDVVMGRNSSLIKQESLDPAQARDKDGSYVHNENLQIALSMAIEFKQKEENEKGYFSDSNLLAGWKQNLAALKKGKLEILNR